MTSDATKNLQSSYNLINLPAQIKSGDTVKANYTYHSDGTKAAAYTTANAGTVLEADDYYPLGGPLPTGSSTTLQPEKYQGKEWNPAASFNVYDFGARLYDPALGRWLSQDPMAEKYYNHSLYLFCAGNPLVLVDIDGKEPIRPDAGTVRGFIAFLNKIPTGIGAATGNDAHSAMLRMGIAKGLTPANTAPFNVSGHNRYIYTRRGGWIDMAHFMFYAGRAYSYKQKQQSAQVFVKSEGFAFMSPEAQLQWMKQASIDPVSETVQDGFMQEFADIFTAPHSAYSYEDLPSDKFGAEFGAVYFDPNSKRTLSEQIQIYLETVLNSTDPQQAPNYNELPESYPKKPTQQNKTTTPFYVRPF